MEDKGVFNTMAETGHIKNVENLGKARDFATGWRATYVPSNPNLAVAAMAALFNTQGVIDGVQTQKKLPTAMRPQIAKMLSSR